MKMEMMACELEVIKGVEDNQSHNYDALRFYLGRWIGREVMP